MKKRFLSVVLCLCMVAGMLPAITTTAQAASNPYPYWQTFTYNGRSYKTITCTYYTWQQVYDRHGISLPSWGNAGSWLSNARNAGYQTGTEPRNGSIAVWDPAAAGTSTGHVGYVTSASGSNFTYNEGGTTNSRANSLGIYEGHSWPDGYTNRPSGFIYLGNSTPANVSVNWGDYYQHNISTTSPVATLARKATISGTFVSSAQCGIDLYNSSGTLVASKREGVTPENGIVNMWYDVAGELGYSLTAGASYTYKFVLNFNGKDYYSPTYSFTAGGSPATYTITTKYTTGGMATGGGSYESGKSVTVYAANSKGYIFKGWMENNRIVSTEAIYNFIVSANRTLTAVFEKEQVSTPSYTVTVNATDGGTVTGGGTYDYLETAWLNASPKEGYRFVSWMEDGSVLNSSAQFGTVVRANRILTAVFEKVPAVTTSYTITVNATEGGTVTGGGSYANGKSATVKATANSGYTFKGWTENGSTVSTSASYTFTVSANRTLTAVFEKEQVSTPIYTITVNATEGGTATGGGTYKEGEYVSLLAVPNEGYKLKHWLSDGKPYTTYDGIGFGVTSDMTMTAVFEKIQSPAATYSINVSASPAEGGTVTGGGSYDKGKSVTVKATANSGYTFKGWTENGSTASTSASYTFTVNTSRTLTAVFEKAGAAVPTITTWPTAAAVNYGQTLANSTLSGGKASVSGMFKWNDTSIVPKTGQSYDVTFTPSDTAKYSTVSGRVSVTVNKSTPTLSVSTSQSGTAVTANVSASNPNNTTLTDVPTPTVTYRIGNGTAQKMTGNSFTIPGGTVSGTVITITASTTENGNYRAAEQSTTLTVVNTTNASTTAPNTTNGTSYHVLTTSGSDLGGSVSIQPASAKQGETVMVSATPRSGYRLETVTATGASGAAIQLTSLGGGRYTFAMPSGNVTLDAAFETIQDDDNGGWVNPFSDIAEGAWYYDAVKFVSQNGLMNGSDGIFDHGGNLSRAMIAQILYNKEGRPATAGGPMFSDVASNAWYADAITWAAANKLALGDEKGLFSPNASITREQLALMLWRYAGSPASSGGTLDFTDAGRISGYAQEAVRWAVNNGVISGKGGGVLDPQGPATRAQVAQMLKNYFGP